MEPVLRTGDSGENDEPDPGDAPSADLRTEVESGAPDAELNPRTTSPVVSDATPPTPTSTEPVEDDEPGASGISDSFQPANGSGSDSREIADGGNAFIGIPKPTLRPTVGRISGTADTEGPTEESNSAPSSSPERDRGATWLESASGIGVPSAVRATTDGGAGEGEGAKAESDTGSLADRTSMTRR